jgi:hypothetical protein
MNHKLNWFVGLNETAQSPLTSSQALEKCETLEYAVRAIKPATPPTLVVRAYTPATETRQGELITHARFGNYILDSRKGVMYY